MAATIEVRNQGVQYDASWFSNTMIDLVGVKSRAETIGKRRSIKKEWQAAWLLRVITCTDLTTLSGKKGESLYYVYEYFGLAQNKVPVKLSPYVCPSVLPYF